LEGYLEEKPQRAKSKRENKGIEFELPIPKEMTSRFLLDAAMEMNVVRLALLCSRYRKRLFAVTCEDARNR